VRSENNAKTWEHKAEQRNTVLVLSLNMESSYTHLTSCLRKLFFFLKTIWIWSSVTYYYMMTKFNYALKRTADVNFNSIPIFPLELIYSHGVQLFKIQKVGFSSRTA